MPFGLLMYVSRLFSLEAGGANSRCMLSLIATEMACNLYWRNNFF